MVVQFTMEAFIVERPDTVEITFPVNPEMPFTAELELYVVIEEPRVSAAFEAPAPVEVTEFFVTRVPGANEVQVGTPPVFDCNRIHEPACPVVTTFAWLPPIVTLERAGKYV
jgi:hypothetical protein